VNDLDFFLIIIYLTCISYVLLQMISALFIEQVEITFDKQDLQNQLELQLLKEVISIEFKMKPRYDRSALPSNVDIIIKNISQHQWIYLEWDYSCLISVDGESKRLVRVPPGSTFDLLPPQMFTVLSPGTRFKEKLSSEAALTRDPETGTLKLDGALINLARLNKDKRRRKRFMRLSILLKEPAKFYIRLLLRIEDKSQGNSKIAFYTINNLFVVKKVHWVQQLPWNVPRPKPEDLKL